MERLKYFIILAFFIPHCVFAHDFSYLEKKILHGSFDMVIFNAVKVVIANGKVEKEFNRTTYFWKDAKVDVLEKTFSKSRYDAPDTIIIFTDKTLGIKEAKIIFNEKCDFYEFRLLRE